ncbi:glucose 1-dehydrogenase [Cytobacillus sp. FJAT-54145]|uniref:Glucose 1-dehydrogenase n=1 Tax=Cytobacillus spartinae TaxID=3299023 RepID=A0ABW6KL13_9BACI
MFTYKGKTVVVTGGANGIGKAIIEAFAQNGANVVIADVDSDKGKELESKLIEKGYPCTFIKTDVQSETEIKNLVAETIREYKKVDVLINNAGISKFHDFFEMTVREWDEIIHTNLRSVFLCTREAAKFMPPSGSIVNIASTRAFMSEKNSEAYSATKGGIVSITHALAMTLSEKRIRVNCISPGWIETNHYNDLREVDHEQHLSGRVGKPEDVARCCLYLCAEGNDFITGENITLDGGMTKKMIYEH